MAVEDKGFKIFLWLKSDNTYRYKIFNIELNLLL